MGHKDLNVKCKIKKLLEGNTGGNLGDLEIGGNILDKSSKIQYIKEKKDVRFY